MRLRQTRFVIRNRPVHVISGQRTDGFEVWITARQNNGGILDHFITHRDFEQKLCYSAFGDLKWSDADANALDLPKHKAAKEAEKGISNGIFLDLERLSNYFTVINLLPVESVYSRGAAELIPGIWSDGSVRIDLMTGNRVAIESVSGDSPSKYLNSALNAKADSWSIDGWQLHLLNRVTMTGERVPILNIDGKEIHIYSKQENAIAHVFRRLK